jgi:hypothetical protein
MQTTLLINITFHRGIDNTLVCEVNVYNSADRARDAAFVEHCMHSHASHYKKKFDELGLPTLHAHTVFSDGAPGHFKQKYNFYNIARCVCSTLIGSTEVD